MTREVGRMSNGLTRFPSAVDGSRTRSWEMPHRAQPQKGSQVRAVSSDSMRRRSFLWVSGVIGLSTSVRSSFAFSRAVYKPVELHGNYGGLGPTGHERQELAQKLGCVCVVDFHFNAAADSSEKGGEVIYQKNSAMSKEFAEAMWGEIRTALPAHGAKPVKSTDDAPRAAYINHYSVPTILLEPLFVSNDDQARWLHDFKGENLKKLAALLTMGIKGHFLSGGAIGLSPGHAYKSSSPKDKGSKCRLGDFEVDHVLEIVRLVKEELEK
jgi:hypothetical protein